MWCSLDSIRASGALDLGSNPSTGVILGLAPHFLFDWAPTFSFSQKEKGVRI